MTRSHVGLGAVLPAVALAVCGVGAAADARSGDDVAVHSAPAELSGQDVRACDLLDLEGAIRVIGPDAEPHGGDTAELICMYSDPGVVLLTLQLGRAELYDQITILPPHTPVQIGSTGRYNVQENGTAAVQFAKGNYSVTLSAQPMGSTQAQYLDPLISVAREAAGRLP